MATGFVVSATQILTNAHVVGGAAAVTVRFISGEERRGTVSAVDGAIDVAVIEVVDIPPGVLRLDWESAPSPAPATAVWAWASPAGRSLARRRQPRSPRGSSRPSSGTRSSCSSRRTRRSTRGTAAVPSSPTAAAWWGSAISSSWDASAMWRGRISRSACRPTGSGFARC